MAWILTDMLVTWISIVVVVCWEPEPWQGWLLVLLVGALDVLGTGLWRQHELARR